ncbi:hypothetical protein ACWDWO_14085 [Actinopolymorpha singaporensis]
MSGPLNEDERAELERLRAEVGRARAETERLTAQLHAAAPAAPEEAAAGAAERPRRLWRTPVAVLVLVLGCLLAPISVVAIWSSTTVSDSNRYVETVAPLARDPAVQNAVASRTTEEIFKRLDLRGLLSQGVNGILASTHLPPLVQERLRSLVGTISNGIEEFVRSKIGDLVKSDQFATAWVQGNRVAHQTLVKVLSGESRGITVQGNTAYLQLGPFIDVAKQRLAKAGFGPAASIPQINPSIALFPAKDLVKLQTAYTWLNRLAIILPILTLALLGAAVVLARRHRRMLLAGGLGLAASMVVLGLVLVAARAIYLNSLPPDGMPPDAAAAIFDTLVRFLQAQLRTLAVVGVVVALGAAATGPSTAAVRTRSVLSTGIGRLRDSGESIGLRTGPVGSWTYDHRTLLRVAVITIAGIGFIAWNDPSIAVVLLLALLVLVALALIEFIARPPGEPRVAALR